MAIIRGDDADAASGLAADGLGVIRRGRLAAVALEVDLAAWSGPEGERHLADVSWLAPRAARHEGVILAMATGRAPDAAGRAGASADAPAAWRPVLPVRFGTLMRDEASVASLLTRHAGAIEQFLNQVEHRAEWSVRLASPREAGIEALTRRLAAERALDEAPAGARYLHLRRLRQDAERQWPALLRGLDDQLVRALSGAGVAHRAARAGRVLDDGSEVLVARSVLAASDQQALIAAACADIVPWPGARVLVDGPFPPYSFAPPLEPAAREESAAAA